MKERIKLSAISLLFFILLNGFGPYPPIISAQENTTQNNDQVSEDQQQPEAGEQTDFPIMVVLDLESTTVNLTDVQMISDFISSSIADVSKNRIKVMDRYHRDMVLKSIDLLTDKAKDSLALGQMLGVDQIITVNVERVAGKYQLVLELYDIKTEKLMKKYRNSYQTINDVVTDSYTFTQKLMEPLLKKDPA